MKEIKFRIWDDKNKKMLYLDEDKISMEDFIKANKEERLMIATGLKDINGNRIFEGDFVDLYNTYKEEYFKGRIKYIGSSAEFVLESADITRHKRWINYEMKVVGNVFENAGYLVKSEEKQEN